MRRLGLDRWLRIVEAAEVRDPVDNTLDNGARKDHSGKTEISQAHLLDMAHVPETSSKMRQGSVNVSALHLCQIRTPFENMNWRV